MKTVLVFGFIVRQLSMIWNRLCVIHPRSRSKTKLNLINGASWGQSEGHEFDSKSPLGRVT